MSCQFLFSVNFLLLKKKHNKVEKGVIGRKEKEKKTTAIQSNKGNNVKKKNTQMVYKAVLVGTT